MIYDCREPELRHFDIYVSPPRKLTKWEHYLCFQPFLTRFLITNLYIFVHVFFNISKLIFINASFHIMRQDDLAIKCHDLWPCFKHAEHELSVTWVFKTKCFFTLNFSSAWCFAVCKRGNQRHSNLGFSKMYYKSILQQKWPILCQSNKC